MYPTNNKEPPLYLLIFVVLSFIFLIIVLSTSYILFPRKLTLWEQLMASFQNQNQQKQGFFEHLMDPGRSLPSPSRIRRGPAGKDVKLEGWSSIENQDLAMGSSNLNKDRLILRENILAQLILSDRHNLKEKNAWANIKRIRSNGNYRDYEEERFLSEILWMNYFDNKSDKNVLRKLKLTTLKLVDKPASYFEDFYNAGIACLLNGDSAKALHFLQKALEQWPARGRALGNVYFGLLMSYAIEEDIPGTLQLLNDFKEYYPDWLHVETYVTDIQELIKTYPESALLHIVHGRLVQNVHDYSTALSAYSTGINSIKPSSEIYPNISRWIKEIEEVE